MAAKKRGAKSGKAGSPKKKRGTDYRWSTDAFCAALEERGTVKAACDALGIGKSSAYRRRSAQPEFAKAWDEALGPYLDDLEEVFRDKARHGWEEVTEVTLYKKDGEGAGEQEILVERRVVTKWSPTPGIFLLKHRRPEVFMERVVAGRLLAESGQDPLEVARQLEELGRQIRETVARKPDEGEDPHEDGFG